MVCLSFHHSWNSSNNKYHITGALGSWGAALLKPYSDRPETSGLLVNTEASLRQQVRQFWLDGWQTVCPLHHIPQGDDMIVVF
jgi:predicted amidohydrolase YtcJ